MVTDLSIETVEIEVNALDSLKRQISTEIPMLINKKVPLERYTFVKRSLDHLLAAQELYDNSNLRLPFWKIESLNSVQLTALKEHLKSTVLHHRDAAKIPSDNRACLDLDSDINIIEHERDHLKGLPDKAKSRSTIDIGFAWSGGKLLIAGGAYYDRTKATDFEKALSASEPKVLSNEDIVLARRLANVTHESTFISTIEERISSRLTVDTIIKPPDFQL